MTLRKILAVCLIGLLAASCSSSKFLDDDEYLLQKVRVEADTKEIDPSQLSPYIRQQSNSKWFSLFKVPLGTYAMAGKDTTKWINRTLRNIGEEPVVYDSVMAQLTCDDLRNALHNMGYMNADVTLQTKTRGHKLTAIYTLHPGIPYFIRSVNYEIQDDSIAQVLQLQKPENQYLKEGMRFTVAELDNERKRVTQLLTHSGYYRFHKDFIRFIADTTRGSRMVDLTMQLLPYRANSDAEETLHPRYTIRHVNFLSGDDGKLHLRHSVLRENTWLEEGKDYSSLHLQKTYNAFGRLSAVRYTSIKFNEVPDTTQLDCNVQISTNKPNTFSFQPEGTNTAGDLGAAVTATYENRNLFRGSETFSVQLRGAFEAITGLEGYQNQDYEEYNVEAKLSFPRFIAPVSKSYRRNSSASSELLVSYNLQNRPEFHRRLFNAAWRYRWTDASQNITYRADVIDLNYIHMPWISSTFKHDYLDSVSNRNAILRYNYEDLFIMKIGFSMAYHARNIAMRVNVETAGNLLNGASHLFGAEENDRGQYTLFNIAYAQYVKGDFDFTHLIRFDRHNQLALHAGFGIAYPYGNSRILPFEKRYFSGGANSVRGWSVRGLGPGSFKGDRGAIDFINQTGDMKVDLNAEYRTFLFWKFDGAVFVDAGNIWTLRNYPDQPGGQFRFKDFYKQIAVAYGLGLRLNFDYFILRFDMGMKAVNPAYENKKEHYPLINPRFSRDFSFHFAVGLPF
ncbi:MAG: BamA/TamA family outer membrane protein [Prevotella sp.]|nr:BamA/TamA family outer membrane protein [Prevotella sp.]